MRDIDGSAVEEHAVAVLEAAWRKEEVSSQSLGKVGHWGWTSYTGQSCVAERCED